MGKPKAVLLILAAALAVCAAVVTLFVYTPIDDHHYGWLVTRAAHYFAGLDVTIEDSFSVEWSSEPLIRASKVRIRDVSGPVQATADLGRFEIKIALRPLISGALLIRHLLIDDTAVSVVHRGGGGEPKKEPSDFPVPVFETVSLSKVRLTVTGDDKTEILQVELEDLSLDDVDDRGPLLLEGKGTLNAEAFEIQGRLGALADMRKGNVPYPVDLNVSVAGFRLHVSGTVDEPIQGKGLNLHVSGEQGELSDTIRLFWKEMPDVGGLRFKTLVTGDVEAPSLASVDIEVSRESQLQFTAKGSLADLLGKRVADLAFAGTCSNKDILGMLPQREIPPLSLLKVGGRLRRQADKYVLEEVTLNASHDRGLMIAYSGKLSIGFQESQGYITDVDAKATVTGPDLGTVAPLLERTRIGRVGPAKGEATIKGPLPAVDEQGTLGISNIKVSAGSKESLWIEGTGSLDLVTRDDTVSVKGFDAQLSASAPSLSTVPALSDLDLPDLRPLSLTARMVSRDGGMDILDIEGLKLDAGTQKEGFLRVEGRVRAVGTGDQKAFEGSFETTSKPWIEKMFEPAAPKDFKVQGKLKVVGTSRDMRIEELTVGTTGDKRLYLTAAGTFREVEGRREFEGHIFSGASDPSVVQSFIGIELPPFATPQVEGRFKGNAGKGEYVGTVRFGRSEFKTTVSHLLTERRPRVTSQVRASTVHLADLGIRPVEPVDSPPQTKDEHASPRPLFSDKPFALDGLKSMDLSLTVDITEMIGKDFILNNLDLDLSLENGRLHITPATVTYAKGSASMDLSMDTGGSTPEMALKVTAEDVDIGAVLSHSHKDPFIKGRLNLVVDLKSTGSTPRETASALNGEIGAAVEEGEIKRIVEFMGADALDFVTAIASKAEYKDLNCMALRFTFEEGVGKSEVIYIESPDMFTKGIGEIDLHSETMKIVLQPKPKRGLRGTTSAVTIKGPIVDPKVRKLPFREAAKLYGEIAMPVVFLPLRGLGYLLNLMKKDKPEESPCLGMQLPPSEEDEAR